MRVRKTTKSELVAPDSFKIHRSSWLNSSTTAVLGLSEMLDERGNMCCLGFFAHACGVGSEHLKNTSVPGEVVRTNEDFPFYNIPLLTNTNGFGTPFAAAAIGINDDEFLTSAEREEKLKKLFRKKGIEVEFVGRYPKGTKKEAAEE